MLTDPRPRRQRPATPPRFRRESRSPEKLGRLEKVRLRHPCSSSRKGEDATRTYDNVRHVRVHVAAAGCESQTAKTKLLLPPLITHVRPNAPDAFMHCEYSIQFSINRITHSVGITATFTFVHDVGPFDFYFFISERARREGTGRSTGTVLVGINMDR